MLHHFTSKLFIAYVCITRTLNHNLLLSGNITIFTEELCSIGPLRISMIGKDPTFSLTTYSSLQKVMLIPN